MITIIIFFIIIENNKLSVNHRYKAIFYLTEKPLASGFFVK